MQSNKTFHISGGFPPYLRTTQATRYCEEVKHSKDGWRLALEVFRSTSRSEARFFCLGCLQDALGARAGARTRVESQHDRYLIREGVLGWVKGVGATELESQEAFIRTKVRLFERGVRCRLFRDLLLSILWRVAFDVKEIWSF